MAGENSAQEISKGEDTPKPRVPKGWEDDPAWVRLAVEHSLLKQNLKKWRKRLSKPNQAVRLGSVMAFTKAIDTCMNECGISKTRANFKKKRFEIVHALFEWPRAFFYDAGNRERGTRRSYTQFLKDRTKNLEITRSTLVHFFGNHGVLPKPWQRRLLASLNEAFEHSKGIEGGWDSHFRNRQPFTGKAPMVRKLSRLLSVGGCQDKVTNAAIEDLLLTCFGIAGSGKDAGDGVRATRNRRR